MMVTRISAAGVVYENGVAVEIIEDRENMTAKPVKRDSEGWNLCRKTGERICNSADLCALCAHAMERMAAQRTMMPERTAEQIAAHERMVMAKTEIKMRKNGIR